ncbi:hypothetical protein M9H77_34423 [Catharanthus roseus]|uniref:Uncharacterized protein n=1 Tax=Catharanthus roseus TaxID=4058 RepID=A0ACB9ZLU8_CATRO|nr:hypothetical protein M9H77_34423 [Catharanthus roseus]
MISRSGIYYPLLVKDFYTNMTQKNNKDLITVKITIKGVNITLERALLAHISSIPNEGLSISFGFTSRIILGDKAWKYSEVSLRVGIHPQPNSGHSRTIRNANDLSARMRTVSNLVGANVVLRPRKSLNELRIIDIYLSDKLLSPSLVNLSCIIIHCMWDTVSTNRKNRVFSFPLLLTDVFQYYEDKDDEEESEGSSKEYDDTNSSIDATLEQMQTWQTQYSDVLADIRDTLCLQEVMMSKIYGCLFLDEGTSGGGGGEGRSTL